MKNRQYKIETLKMILNNPKAAIERLNYNPLKKAFIPDGENYREINSNQIITKDEVMKTKNCYIIVPASSKKAIKK